ncbi:MAG: hypothetical protein SFY92_07125 [Verrucomicrobiae bacterium]|nr:hypothetical protein [Verrucomicrobiae bacterium]
MSMLYFEGAGYRREDMSLQAWRERDGSSAIVPASYWQSKFVPPPPAPVEALKKDDAEGLLRRLLEKRNPRFANAIYILAVMLERKRIFKQIDTFRQDLLGKVIVYEHLKTGESFTIIDPELRLDLIEPVQREVVDLLEGRTPIDEVPPSV